MLVSAACHVHSDWSYDGSWSLPNIATEFRRRGYRVVMLTEHDRGFTESRRLAHRAACAEASTSEVLLIPGIEYSDASNTLHILSWGNIPFLGEGVETTKLLHAVRDADGVAVMAHPSRRRAWTLFEPKWAECLHGIEVWNRKTDGWAPSRRAGPLLESSGLTPFVGMDFHDRRQFFPLAMTMDLPAKVTEEAVLDSLRKGQASATALRTSVDSQLISRGRVVLDAAELGRRIAAWGYRRTRRAVLADPPRANAHH